MPDQKKNSCSFCGRSAREAHLIEGLDAMICADCVELCMSILVENGYQSHSHPQYNKGRNKKKEDQQIHLWVYLTINYLSLLTRWKVREHCDNSSFLVNSWAVHGRRYTFTCSYFCEQIYETVKS